MRTTHHIVYSTKGGCGKTVFSLLLAHCEHDFNKLQKITINPESYDEVLAKDLLNGNASSDIIGSGNQPRKINCFIDLDFLSSSLTYYLGDKPGFDNSIKEKEKNITLQSLIEKKNYPNELKFVSCCDKGKKSLFIIPIDASQTQKEIFYVKRNNTPLLRYEEVTIFIEYIQKSVEVYLLGKGLNDKDELNFIYDLPLNSDGYTEAVLDEIFKLKENDKKVEEQIKVRLYLVANCDPMMKCNLDWFASFINTFREKKCDVVIVCNNNLGCFEYIKRAGRMPGGLKEELKSSVNDVINKVTCDSTLKDYIKHVVYIDKGVISLKESNSKLEFKDSNIEIYDL